MNSFLYLFAFTIIVVLISFAFDRNKTIQGLKRAWKKFSRILPAFSIMLIIVSIALWAFPQEMISKYLGADNILLGILVGGIIGTITFMPGFIVFPLAGILASRGVPYMVLSTFTTTMMMVGVLTFPLEKEYFGIKITIIRNLVGLLIAALVAISVGFFYGEITI